jgi:hypothetical protein
MTFISQASHAICFIRVFQHNLAGWQQIASAKEIIKVPRKEDIFSSCASSRGTMER